MRWSLDADSDLLHARVCIHSSSPLLPPSFLLILPFKITFIYMIVKLTYIFTEDSEKNKQKHMKKIKITHNLLP